MIERISALVVLLSFAFLTTGCATLRGDTQKMKVETDPAGATLTVDGKQYTTPVEVPFKRKEAHKVSVSKAGYRPLVFNLEAQWDGASLTDLAVPGGSALLGLSVITGSDKSFKSLAKITLEKSTEPNPTPLEVYQFEGRLLTKADYDKAVADRAANQTFYREP
jgi:hypothetical protein